LVGDVAEKYAEIFGQARLDYMVDWWAANRTPDRFAIVNHNSASRSSEVFETLILARKYLPNQQMRFCTIEMKIRTAKRYLMSLGWEHWTNCVGFRADEPHRLNKPPPRDRWTVWAPLAIDGRGRHHVTKFWNEQSFDLELPNNNGKLLVGKLRRLLS
jgi:hypothetical protein